jgi:hypothetical protein
LRVPLGTSASGLPRQDSCHPGGPREGSVRAGACHPKSHSLALPSYTPRPQTTPAPQTQERGLLLNPDSKARPREAGVCGRGTSRLVPAQSKLAPGGSGPARAPLPGRAGGQGSGGTAGTALPPPSSPPSSRRPMIESRLSFSLSDMAAPPLRPSSSGPAPASRPPAASFRPGSPSAAPGPPPRLLGRPPAPPRPAAPRRSLAL